MFSNLFTHDINRDLDTICPFCSGKEGHSTQQRLRFVGIDDRQPFLLVR